MSDTVEQTDDGDADSGVEESAPVDAASGRSSQGTRVRGAGAVESEPEKATVAAPGAEPTSDEGSEPAADPDSAADPGSAVDPGSVVDPDATAGTDPVSGPDEDDEDDNPLETEAEIAADYLEELLDIADLDGDIDTYIEGERAHVSIVSESEVLVGARGEVLDALQELTRLAVMTETGDRSRLMLDVAGFRDRRRKQLVGQAAAAVSRAKESKQPVPLEPMNPFERKIVHDAVAAAGLSSQSEGDEPNRHVVVQPQA